jgi:hypothetical protein
MRGSGLAGAAGAAVVALACGVAGAAHAEPGLANKVYDPYVRNGVTEVELRAGRLTGGELARNGAEVIELEHGFSDRVSVALVAEFEKEPGVESRLDSLGVESVVYLGQIPNLGVDVGAYVEYEQRVNAESGVAEAKLLLARQFGPVHALLNLIADKPLSNKHDENATEFGYAAQGTVEAAPHLQVGLQAFGELGTDRSFGGPQSHYVGPVANWELRPRGLPGELELETAYLFAVGPVSRQTDGQVRLMLEYERRF